ncbi:MAG: mechanosensitive ion channel family protein [Acidimicrobiales bacterium]|nr:MAG: mechanosensitive ion channel family protein [Acidimicrobiales bacterium]
MSAGESDRPGGDPARIPPITAITTNHTPPSAPYRAHVLSSMFEPPARDITLVVSDDQQRNHKRTNARVMIEAAWDLIADNASVEGKPFAMSEVIGALAGWFNIVSGSICKVGDRVQVGGVRGDVIDITPLRTKVMEIGSDTGEATWVRGRVYTGRIVAISNKMTFTEPVFNYSASFDFLWEEVAIPVAYRDDRQQAAQIMREEAVRVSTAAEAETAIADMVHRYPVARTEVEPRVFVNATDNYVEISARLVVPVRTSRRMKDEFTRRVLERFTAAGIAVASPTQDLTLRPAESEPSPPLRAS